MACSPRNERQRVAETFLTHTFPNGLVLLAQPMQQVSSAAMTVVLPAGAALDPTGLEGAASVGAEWLFRGAGDRDSRGFNDALDALGCQHSESVHSRHLQLSTVQLSRTLPDVLDLYADLLRSPRLPEDAFEPCRQLVAQDLAGLDDEPARKCTYLLRERFFPHPLGRVMFGSAESLAAMTPAGLREHLQDHLSPAGCLIGLAGDFDWDAFRAKLEDRLGDWPARPEPTVDTTAPAGGATHIEKDTAQTHIALAHRAVPLGGEGYYAARLAETVLARGMASRLFSEVREKRGLAYHVSTTYASLKDHAGFFTYAGTRPELAEQTFDVTVGELQRLREGIDDEELHRAKTQLRSSLVMQGASTSSRASSLVNDYYHLGTLRTLQDLSRAIDAVTQQDILDYLDRWPAEDFTLLTVGPKPLDAAARLAKDA